MPLTDAQFNTWLESPDSIRCVLVEVNVKTDAGDITRYLSSANYVTSATASPPNTAYYPVLSGGVSVTEKLTLDGSASLSYGDVELNNLSGELDGWLSEVWVNRTITVFCGDVRWPKGDFRLVFSGITAGIASRSRETMNIALRDKSQRLNNPSTEVKLEGDTTNKDKLLPLCFGECHNVEPLLLDSGTLEYQVHNGPIESIIEVRDSGVPVDCIVNLTRGTFKLTAQPAGAVTVSVQGAKVSGIYSNTVAALVKLIISEYGTFANRVSPAEIDQTNFNTFDANHQQPVGIYLSDRSNIIEVCAVLASSVGAQLVLSREGKYRLLQIDLAGTPASTWVGLDHIVAKSLSITDRPDVKAAVQVGYCKNWTVQTNLQTGIPEDHKDLFKQEWLTFTTSDSLVAANYKLTEVPIQETTMLLDGLSAAVEASRRLNLWSAQRNVYSFKSTAGLQLQQLGSYITLAHPRFGLSAGKLGQIVGMTQDWLHMQTDFEVLI